MTSPNWERVYDIDLVYERDCWKLCGDAHCCNFQRHKQNFKVIGKKPFQELPLLPGEYEFMRDRGWLAQFHEHEHKKIEIPLDSTHAIHFESIVSYRAGGCACEHATRPTICRLYPLLPVLDVDGRVLGIENNFGIYEELEALEGAEKACKIDRVPTDQLNKFLQLVAAVVASPVHLFYLHAYRIAKQHVADRLRDRLVQEPQNAFGLFEWQTLRSRLFDAPAIRSELVSLVTEFENRYPDTFSLPRPEDG